MQDSGLGPELGIPSILMMYSSKNGITALILISGKVNLFLRGYSINTTGEILYPGKHILSVCTRRSHIFYSGMLGYGTT